MTTTEFLPNELPLSDDYPVYWDYIYIADGKIVRSEVRGTVGDLKRNLKANEIRNCDIIARQKTKV